MSVRLFCGDCLDVMPTLETGNVDAVITDPPFGVGFDYRTGYDDSLDSYQVVVNTMLTFERCVTEGGFFAVYQPAKHMRLWHKLFDRDWKPIALCKNFVQGGRGDILSATDYVLWWQLGKGRKAKEWQEVFARDWFKCDTTPARRDPLSRGHPCPRPIDGVRYLVECFCPPGGTVLDQYMGSGTTGVACVQTGRNFIGIEIDPDYFSIAQQRIKAAQTEMVQASFA